jgi:hypothetical protein
MTYHIISQNKEVLPFIKGELEGISYIFSAIAIV